MPSFSELLCQRCGSVERAAPPSLRLDSVSVCPCGGQRQVVRVGYEPQARMGNMPFPFDWVPSLRAE